MRVPTKSLSNITPYEAYHRRKPDISHLREIGCCVFVLILNKHNPKIFQRSEEHVLIGYGKDSKTYRCYHRATHKVIESYHVTFIESKDKGDVSFRPGMTQGLEDDPPELSNQVNQMANPTPNPTLSLLTPPQTMPTEPTTPPLASNTSSITQNEDAQRSSRVMKPSTCSAATSGVSQISTIQRATAESIASRA